MPFYSFILKNSCLPSDIGLYDESLQSLKINIRYYSKNTKAWNNLRNNKLKDLKHNISFEKHQKFNSNINKVIFCLPPNIGLGDAVEYGLAIKAIEKEKIFKNFAVAFSSTFSKILRDNFNFNSIYPDFIREDEINKYNNFFHFTSEIKSLKFQKYQRSNIEKEITEYFNIKPYRKIVKDNIKIINNISIFPISKSPIRTFQPSFVNEIIEYLKNNNFNVKIILDRSSDISNEFEKKLKLDFVEVYSPNNVNELNDYCKKIEFAIFCDSGPLHLSKLYGKKGLLISTSVDSSNLISKFDNILTYNSRYKTLYCNAPCGLTNIINYNGNHGCFDTLKINKKDIMIPSKKNLLNRGNLAKSYKFYTNIPVGCVKSLSLKNIKTLLDKALNI